MSNGNCCPDCGDRYSVIESRLGDAKPIMVYRRRYCAACDYTIWTVEVPFSGDVPGIVRNAHKKKMNSGDKDAR